MAPGDRIACTDKTGNPFELEQCGMECAGQLLDMYNDFVPMGESQGLPPISAAERERWVLRLLDEARNFVAWQEGKIAGHCALIPDPARLECEYIIFVSRGARNKGLGRQLTEMAVRLAQSLEWKRIWLTVESYNFRAIKLYRRTGFQFVDEGGRERTMVLGL
jgi:RimJ/RimL family protein N-acetyltransferase